MAEKRVLNNTPPVFSHWWSVFSRGIAGCLAIMALLSVAAVSASQDPDPAWRDFQHELGQPPLIGANADHELATGLWRPIPAPPSGERDTEKFRLGSDLFHEGRLSSANSVACVTCHAGALSGADRRPVSVGVGGARGTKNALSVFNAVFNFRQFWDGRAVTLEDQSLEPIENPVEMAHTLEAVRETLRDDPEYAERFESIYPDGVTINNMSDALAHFQRINFLRLDTPFQRYLNGEHDALDEQERRGMRRFRKIGCASCHNGINLGGNSYQKLGSATAYYGANREAGPHDMGVMDRSDRERDRHVFRVPGLHGVATTPPYFHDGSVSTLEEAIDRMGQFQLGRELSQQDINDIEAFLRSLGGHFNSSGAATDDRLRAEEEAARDLSGMTHAEAYRSAMASLEAAGERLLTELRRIDEGDVAHFDFLQREHLEMIRYARALGHPPAALEESVREALKAAARETLDRVIRLEWVIADFLRAEAMTRVFAAHLEVPATAALPEGVADPESALNEHMARAEEAMAAMMEARPAESAAAVRRVYADVD